MDKWFNIGIGLVVVFCISMIIYVAQPRVAEEGDMFWYHNYFHGHDYVGQPYDDSPYCVKLRASYSAWVKRHPNSPDFTQEEYNVMKHEGMLPK